MPNPAQAEKGVSMARCSGKLARIVELKIHWETVPWWIKWRAVKEDTWHQFLASSHTCTYKHVPTQIKYMYFYAHITKHECLCKNIIFYKQKKLSMLTFGDLNTLKWEGITFFFCNQTSGILTSLIVLSKKAIILKIQKKI